MIVVCARCKAENQLTDTLDRKIEYRCNVCRKRLTSISNANFGRIAALALIAWWMIAALVWVSVYMVPVTEVAVGGFFWSFIFGVTAMLMTVYFLQAGRRHRRTTGVSPRGFQRFVLLSVLGACTCFAASGLAFAWWDWRA